MGVPFNVDSDFVAGELRADLMDAQRIDIGLPALATDVAGEGGVLRRLTLCETRKRRSAAPKAYFWPKRRASRPGFFAGREPSSL
jgi:hypothetical protein